jgi:hypothetical protein
MIRCVYNDGTIAVRKLVARRGDNSYGNMLRRFKRVEAANVELRVIEPIR